MVVILSPPSPITVWAVPAMRALFERVSGSVDVVSLSTAAQFRDDWKKRKSKNLIFFSDCPEVELTKILVKGPIPTIFFAEQPPDVALYLLKAHVSEPAMAVRAASASLSALHDLVLNSRNLLHISPRKSPKAFMEEIIEFLGIRLDRAMLEELLLAVGAPVENDPGTLALFEQQRQARELTSTEAALISTLRPFGSLFQSRLSDEFVWPPGMFFVADPLGAALVGAVDLQGPARVFLYGPYLHLPTGIWNADIVISIAENLSGNELRAEILSSHAVITEATARLPTSGTFTFTLRFTVTEPRDPLQLRLAILEGAIEGVLDLVEVKVRRRKHYEAQSVDPNAITPAAESQSPAREFTPAA